MISEMGHVPRILFGGPFTQINMVEFSEKGKKGAGIIDGNKSDNENSGLTLYTQHLLYF